MTATTTKKTLADSDCGAISARALIWWIGSLLAALAAMGTLHARFVIPSILQEARKMMTEEMASHERVLAHDGAVPRTELEARLAAQAKTTELILTSINSRLSRIESRLDEK